MGTKILLIRRKKYFKIFIFFLYPPPTIIYPPCTLFHFHPPLSPHNQTEEIIIISPLSFGAKFTMFSHSSVVLDFFSNTVSFQIELFEIFSGHKIN